MSLGRGTAAPSGDDGLNAEEKFHILLNVAVTGTLVFNLNLTVDDLFLNLINRHFDAPLKVFRRRKPTCV